MLTYLIYFLVFLIFLTVTTIAEILGGSLSRNAVIGKAHRLNLSAKIKTRSTINNSNSISKTNEKQQCVHKFNWHIV